MKVHGTAHCHAERHTVMLRGAKHPGPRGEARVPIGQILHLRVQDDTPCGEQRLEFTCWLGRPDQC